MGPHTAMVLESVLKAVHWVNHTVGYQAHPAEVVENGLLGEELPACYTSTRPHANRSETGTRLHWDQKSALAHAARGHSGHWHKALWQGQKVLAQQVAHRGSGRGPAGSRQKGLPPGGSSQNSSPAGLWWEQPSKRGTLRAPRQGKVSFTSRHRQQRWSPALALYMLAAARGHGGGGRKQNRGKLARWAK